MNDETIQRPEDERDPSTEVCFWRVAACPNDAFVSRALRISPVVRSEAKAAGRTKDSTGIVPVEQFTSLEASSPEPAVRGCKLYSCV